MKTDADDETKSIKINDHYDLEEQMLTPNTKKPAAGWFLLAVIAQATSVQALNFGHKKADIITDIG